MSLSLQYGWSKGRYRYLEHRGGEPIRVLGEPVYRRDANPLMWTWDNNVSSCDCDPQNQIVVRFPVMPGGWPPIVYGYSVQVLTTLKTGEVYFGMGHHKLSLAGALERACQDVLVRARASDWIRTLRDLTQ